MRVHTESGSVYEIDDDKVRRVGNHDMRGDGEWLTFRHLHPVTVGLPMGFVLEPLGMGDITLRTTSRVTRIEGES